MWRGLGSKISLLPSFAGATPEDGVPDMTVISDIDEYGINTNLKVRYGKDLIYVSATTAPPVVAVLEEAS